MCFKYGVNDEVVFANVLRENFDFFQNHTWAPFTDK